ncbi:LPXTG cell wall anchor domain-containing protein [Mycetocola zhadangensis]|uniref:LPXTG cell wall anchor domain-containing protein n=1 Tax=Mycetocola zhadangensis TaxID=1164595 RepID=UPI003A4E0A33
MTRRVAPQAALGIAALVGTLASVVGISPAYAEHDDRALHITRVDGSPVGTLFTDWVMVPGDTIKATVVAHRTGHGASSLLITLGDRSNQHHARPTPVEQDIIVTAEANGVQIRASAAALMLGDASLDLGRSSDPIVPIDVSFELPFSSANATQLQMFNLSVVVTAADIPVPSNEPETPIPHPAEETPDLGGPGAWPTATNPAGREASSLSRNRGILESVIPLLPHTGASVREVLIVGALLTSFGLLLLGRRRKSRSYPDPG